MLNAMKKNTSSKFTLICAIALAAVFTSSATFAAKQQATKRVVQKKVEAPGNAMPPLPAQQSLAPNPPALAAKAWLLMDFDSGELLASANVDEALPPASLTKMMTSFLVEQALGSGKLKPTDLV